MFELKDIITIDAPNKEVAIKGLKKALELIETVGDLDDDNQYWKIWYNTETKEVL